MVDYKKLLEARAKYVYVSEVFESGAYDRGLKMVERYQDPLVWCYAVTPFLLEMNKPFYINKSGRQSEKLIGIILDMVKELCSELAKDNVKDKILRFRELRLEELEEAELESLKPAILDLFTRFARMESIGSTGASELLHLLAPKFFVMWNDKIREYYGLKGKEDAEDYFEFLKKMRREIREAVEGYAKDKGIEDFRKARDALEKELGKLIIKVMDEYNFLKTKGII